MNRAGRLFVEFIEKGKLTNERRLYRQWERSSGLFEAGIEHDVFRINKAVALLIQWHFAELYTDAYEKNRTLILGLLDATFVGVVFKS